MQINYMQEARTLMFESLLQAWNEACELYADGKQTILWPTVINNETKKPDGIWSRCSINHSTMQGCTTLADSSGSKFWARNGILTLQIFVPMSTINCYNVCENLCVYVRDYFEQLQSCITYRQISAIEIGEDLGFYNFNFIAKFNYSEFK